MSKFIEGQFWGGAIFIFKTFCLLVLLSETGFLCVTSLPVLELSL